MTNYFILKDSNGIMQESADTFQEALSKKTATTAVIEKHSCDCGDDSLVTVAWSRH